jgi:hypothetical protein
VTCVDEWASPSWRCMGVARRRGRATGGHHALRGTREGAIREWDGGTPRRWRDVPAGQLGADMLLRSWWRVSVPGWTACRSLFLPVRRVVVVEVKWRISLNPPSPPPWVFFQLPPRGAWDPTTLTFYCAACLATVAAAVTSLKCFLNLTFSRARVALRLPNRSHSRAARIVANPSPRT